MLLNPRALRKLLITATEKNQNNLKKLRRRLLKDPWKVLDSKTDGTNNINQNEFAGSVNNEQVRKDTNLTGRVEDASELYISVLTE